MSSSVPSASFCVRSSVERTTTSSARKRSLRSTFTVKRYMRGLLFSGGIVRLREVIERHGRLIDSGGLVVDLAHNGAARVRVIVRVVRRNRMIDFGVDEGTQERQKRFHH